MATSALDRIEIPNEKVGVFLTEVDPNIPPEEGAGVAVAPGSLLPKRLGAGDVAEPELFPAGMDPKSTPEVGVTAGVGLAPKDDGEVAKPPKENESEADAGFAMEGDEDLPVAVAGLDLGVFADDDSESCDLYVHTPQNPPRELT